MTDLLGRRLVLLLALIVCASFSVASFAQSTVDGSIGGTVTDQSKAVVPNAKVSVVNVGTNREFTTNSDGMGKFRVTGLQPGTYSVTVTAPSFADFKATVIVEVGLVTSIEAVMPVAGKGEVVEVTSEAPVINVSSQDFTGNINEASIANLPTNGRRWSNFALLTPGAAPGDGYGLISFRGISGLMNNSTVDGGDNNQAFFSEERGRTRTNYVVSQASVREFQVNTSNYSAEYGRAAGGVVNTVTKSGTNSPHGEIFYYIRDNAIGATNSFTTHLVQQPDGSYQTLAFKPTDRRQQFGGNFGGALVKDKLFFFFNYDGQRQNIPGVAMPSSPLTLFGPYPQNAGGTAGPCTTPTDALLAVGVVPDTTFGCGELSTMVITRGITQQQAHDALAFLATTTGTQPRTNDQNIFFPKLDWVVTQNNTLTLSYNRLRRLSPSDYQTAPVVSYALGDWGNDGVKVDMINARLSSAIHNTISNEFRMSWGRELDFSTVGPQSSAYDTLKGTASALYNGMLGDTYFSGGASYNIGLPYTLNRYAYPDERRAQFANSTSMAKGRHLFKFGADFTRTQDRQNSLFQAGGDYSYSNRVNWIVDYTNALKGTPSRNYGGYTQGLGAPEWQFHTYEYAVFANDDVRVGGRLTLNLGVRYEYESLPSAQIINPALPLSARLPRDRNNVGPRIGFALDVFGNGKTSLRGGYGIYYGRFVNSTIASAIYGTGLLDASGNPLGQGVYSYCATATSSCAQGPTYPNIVTRASASTQNVAYFAPRAQIPQIHQADLVLERQIAQNTVVSVSYLMSLGRQMVNFLDQNEVPSTLVVNEFFNGGPFDGATVPITIYTSKANTAFGHMSQIVTNVNSSYNAMVVQANRRMTKGLQFQASYTWAHALDSGQNATTFTSNNNYYDPFNMAIEYGNSNWDIRQRIVGSAVWQPQYFANSGGFVRKLLTGWSLSPIVVVSSGQPFTEAVNGYPSNRTWTGGAYAWSGSSLNESGGSSRIAPLVGRNNWRYPWLQNIDLRLGRSFHITERQQVQIMADAFNLFNHRNTTSLYTTMYNICSSSSTPACTVADGGVIPAGQVPLNTWLYDSRFGSMTAAGNTLYRERQLQFAIKYSF